MFQQGQVFKLKAKNIDGQPLWAYRYRLEGRDSARPQIGGFATRAEALKALEKVLARLGPGGRAATMTLAELVDEYLEMHQAEPVRIAKLRWLLGKATATLGQVRLADLSPKDVHAWRLTIPEGHRFEATQALRQVLNRAVTWGPLEYNPAKRGVPNPLRRYKEKRPFESWQQIDAVAERLGSVYGPMVVFAAATGLRPSELFALEQRDIDRPLGVVYVRRAYANGRLKHTKTRLSNRAVPLLDHRLALYGAEQRMVFGANTYRAFARMLASSTEESEVRDPWVTRMMSLPATAVSTTLEGPLNWPNATVVSGDAVDVVARLKEESHVPLRSHGSLSMNRALMAAGLVDRIQVTLFPVITGQTGLDPIFQGAADFDLELVENRTLDGHIQELIYRPTLH